MLHVCAKYLRNDSLSFLKVFTQNSVLKLYCKRWLSNWSLKRSMLIIRSYFFPNDFAFLGWGIAIYQLCRSFINTLSMVCVEGGRAQWYAIIQRCCKSKLWKEWLHALIAYRAIRQVLLSMRHVDNWPLRSMYEEAFDRNDRLAHGTVTGNCHQIKIM